MGMAHTDIVNPTMVNTVDKYILIWILSGHLVSTAAKSIDCKLAVNELFPRYGPSSEVDNMRREKVGSTKQTATTPTRFLPTLRRLYMKTKSAER